MSLNKKNLNPLDLMTQALSEDAPHGDLTCDSLNLPSEKTIGLFIAKEDLVLSGMDFIVCLKDLNLDIDVEVFFKDGSKIKKGQNIARLYGPWTHLLFVERVTLNFIGKLSGIATLTQKFVREVEHTSCKILDTRKTTPLFRHLEKKAVLDGGGLNHRMNLSDEIILKENHISRCTKDLKTVLFDLRQKGPKTKITVECQTLDEVQTVSLCPIDQIMLDNMDNETIKTATTLIPKHIKIEASGNMTLNRVKSVAETGIDYISVGALTHSAPVADISFLLSN